MLIIFHKEKMYCDCKYMHLGEFVGKAPLCPLTKIHIVVHRLKIRGSTHVVLDK